MQFSEIVIQLSRYATPSSPLYLVGGAVRDSILTKPCTDYDIVCSQDPRLVARKFANEYNGDFFIMDEDRDTCRVLIDYSSSTRVVVDFTAMRGAEIREDLSKRDFTINAMAVDLLAPEQVIDPFKGGRDLQQKWLRVVTPASFIDDPLRVIRAIRYAVNLGLKMEPGMADLINKSVSGLQGVSAERKRDELFKIFSGHNIHAALQLLHKFMVFDYIPLTIKSEFAQLVTDVRALEDTLGWLCGEKTHQNQAAFYQSSLLVELGRFKEDLRRHYLTKNQSGRDRRSLLFLTKIIEERNEVEKTLRNLRLSMDEIHLVSEYKAHSHLCNSLISQGKVPEPVDIYRFFKATASSGIDLAVSALGDYVALVGSEFSQSHWLLLLKVAGTLMHAWFENTDIVAPVPLLNGDALIQRFSLKPGPNIGQLLERIKEEQIKGGITNENEAVEWIQKRIKEK